MGQEQLRANDLAKMKGASSWLTLTSPLKFENFNLNKREFYDAFSLQYHWTPKYLPSTCPGGKIFDVDHAVSCMKGDLSNGGITMCERPVRIPSQSSVMMLR